MHPIVPSGATTSQNRISPRMHTHDGKIQENVDAAGSDVSSAEERAHHMMGALEGSLSQVTTALFEIERHNPQGSSKTLSELLTRCIQAHDVIQTRFEEMRDELAPKTTSAQDP